MAIAELTAAERDAMLAANPEWALARDGKAIERTFQFGDFSEAWGFMNRVALLAREETGGPSASGTPPVFSASIEAVDALFAPESASGVRGPDSTPFPDRRRPETMFALLDDPALREPSFLFFIGTALCEESSKNWPEWNARVKEILLAGQDREGYWPAGGDWPFIDGGDIYTTALSILTLQVYYRFIKLEVNCP